METARREGPHGEMFLPSFVLERQPITALIDGQPRACRRFFELQVQIDTEWVFVDGSYVRDHLYTKIPERAPHVLL